MLIFTNNSLIQTYFATNYHEMYIFIGFVPDRVFYLFFFSLESNFGAFFVYIGFTMNSVIVRSAFQLFEFEGGFSEAWTDGSIGNVESHWAVWIVSTEISCGD